MTPRTPQCEVFWALLLNSKHLGVPEDSKSPTLGVSGFTPTLGQSGVATNNLIIAMNVKCPKKTNRWAHLGRLLNFYKSYRSLLLEHTKDKRPDLMPSD